MMVVNGTFRLPVERRAEAIAAMERVVTATRAEAGCASYVYAEDVFDAGLFHAVELWESKEALQAHFQTPHMIAWQEEREALGMTERRIAAFYVSGVLAL